MLSAESSAHSGVSGILKFDSNKKPNLYYIFYIHTFISRPKTNSIERSFLAIVNRPRDRLDLDLDLDQ